MRLHHAQLTIRRSMAVVALLAVLFAFGLVPLITEISRQNRQNEYKQVADEMTSAIFALENRVPQGVNPSDWKSAVRLTAMAHFNTCWRWHPPSIEELYRLHKELMPKLRSPVDIQTLSRAWDRLARTCVDGKDYTDRYRRSFQECFPPGTIHSLREEKVTGTVRGKKR
jgi:hypothetical protein